MATLIVCSVISTIASVKAVTGLYGLTIKMHQSVMMFTVCALGYILLQVTVKKKEYDLAFHHSYKS